MIVLAFDTALGACTAGVWRDGSMLAEEHALMPQGHAEALMPMIERVMSQANLTYNALDRIAVTVGPGSFTGLRVGIATARGLAMAAGKPAVGITTTEALAAAVGDARHPILSVIDSKRGDTYAQMFAVDDSSEIVNLSDAALSETFPGPLVLVGDAAARLAAVMGSRAEVRTVALSPAHIARLAAAKPLDPRGPLPVYVRGPDVTLRADGGMLRP